MNLMVRMGRVVSLVGVCLFVAAGFAEESISITATPRYPWNGKVDLRFTISAGETDGGYDTSQPGDDDVAGRRLKFIRSAGDVQLNTGVVPGSKNVIELKIEWDGNEASPKGCLFCARGNTTSTATFTGFVLSGKWRFDYQSSLGTEIALPTLERGVPVVIRDVAGTARVDGSSVQTRAAAEFTVGGPLTLFSSYIGSPGNTVDNYFTGKVYYLKIYGDDKTTLLHDFVPWEKGNEVGLYDFVDKRFVPASKGTLLSGTKYATSFTASDVAGGTNLTMKTLFKSNGAAANVGKEQLLPGTYNWVWDAAADLGESTVLDRVVVEGETTPSVYYVKFNANGGTGTMANEEFAVGVAKALTANAFKRTGYTFQGWATSANGAVVYKDKQLVSNLTMTVGAMMNLYAVWEANLYMVVDLSSGAISYLDAVPSGGWSSTYRKTKLVLRYIKRGTFKEAGKRTVNLTHDYYIGVFEMTQKQYATLGLTVASSYIFKGDIKPMQLIGYNEVMASSGVVRKLNNLTKKTFSLPTEAQWEYACRAGTTTSYNNGGSSEADLKKVGQYKGNSSGVGVGDVGGYAPNEWGLYDMHGNVWEWCSDWYAEISSVEVSDPKGPSSGAKRVLRGGGYDSTAAQCTSGYRFSHTPDGFHVDYEYDGYGYNVGIRVCLTL